MSNTQNSLNEVIEQINQIIANINVAMSHLNNVADNIVTSYWDEQFQHNYGVHRSKKSKMGCRIRTINEGLYIQWFWNKFIPSSGNKNKKMKVFSNHIRISKGQRYSKASLEKYAHDWEIESLLRYEDQFAHIRRIASKLVEKRKRAREALVLLQALSSYQPNS